MIFQSKSTIFFSNSEYFFHRKRHRFMQHPVYQEITEYRLT